MAKNAKYYVVWSGIKPGIYTSWEECKAQIHAVPNARYKSYKTLKEAREAYTHPPQNANTTPRKGKSRLPAKERPESIIRESLSVDAACSGNPGVMEYRGVHTGTGEEIFHKGPFAEGTNNIGEFLAIVHALALLRRKGDETTPVYTDSRTALSWVKAGKARTTLGRNRRTEELHILIARAEAWLTAHTWKNPLIKWDTARWGEIPADFGRK